MRVVIRGFAEGKLLFKDQVEVEGDDALEESLLLQLAEKHGDQIARHALHMIEIEFLDEPDPIQRFFRFGTDRAGMVEPVRIDL